MACSCSKNKGQVTKFKQVIKKPVVKKAENSTPNSVTKPIIKRIIYKRPI